MANLLQNAQAFAQRQVLHHFPVVVSYRHGSDVYDLACNWQVGADVEATDPEIAAKLYARLSDFHSAPMDGDMVTSDGKVYMVVRHPQPDSYGGINLQLRFSGLAS